MNNEYLALIENETWTLIEKPENAQVFRMNVVFNIKEDDYLKRFRARFVIDGHPITKNCGYTPTASIESIRLILAYAVQHNL